MRDEVKNIWINGYSPMDRSKWATVEEIITPRISAVRAIVKRGTTDHDSWWHEGRRFNDDSTVISRILSGMSREKLKLDYLTELEMDYLIERALIDCAGADYYYTYEKDWG